MARFKLKHRPAEEPWQEKIGVHLGRLFVADETEGKDNNIYDS